MFSFAEMEISYNAGKYRQYESSTYDPDYAIERCAEWLTETKEGREYFFEAVTLHDDYFDELDKLLTMPMDTGDIRQPKDFTSMGQHMAVFIDKWVNKIAECDYEKILQITNYKLVESDGL